ncbi:hypothetical protein BU17DRAFT_79247 [Hysterangium stoloniferum]|nr:hypothetical protein BU17DRAFT_79247 [Hysterangium stoloniferum]
MEKESSRKRKRELDIDVPRIKYHVTQSGRSFERLLKENSREEMCDVVRKKLDLGSKASLELVQMREGVRYDLEDDDDFEALKSAAYAYSALDIHVSYRADSHAQSGSASNTLSSKKPKTKKRVSIVPPEETGQHTTQDLSVSAVINQTSHTNSVGPDLSTDIAERPIKRRKTNQSSPTVVGALPTAKRKVIKDTAETNIATTETPVAVEEEKGPPQKKQKTKENGKEKPISTKAADTSTVTAELSEEVAVKPKSTISKSKKMAPEVATQVVPTEGPSLPKENKKMGIKNIGEGDCLSIGVELIKLFHSEEARLDALVNANKTLKTTTIADKPAPNSTSGQSNSSHFSSPTTTEKLQPSRPNLTYAELKSRRLAATQALTSSTSSAPLPQTIVASSVPDQQPSVVAKPKSKAKITAGSKEARDPAELGKPDTSKRPQSMDNAATKKPKDMDNATKLNDISYKAKGGIKPAKNNAVVKAAGAGPEAKPGEGDSSTDEHEHEKDHAVSAHSKGLVSAPVQRPPTLSALTGKKKSEKIVARQNPCELCHGPYHFRHLCPVITSGIDSISKRLVELRAEGGEVSLIKELEVWERGEKEKAVGKSKLVGSKINPPATKTNQKTHSSSAARSWPPVVPPKSKLSEVAVESHEEGSESDTTTSDGEGAILKSRSSSESPSSSEIESISPSVDLANVDLEGLLRGPSLKATAADLSRLEEEEAKEKGAEVGGDGNDVDKDGVLEEEEEEPISTRPRLSFTAMAMRSSSPETGFGVDDSDSDELTNMDPDQTKEVPHPSQAAMSEAVEPSLPDVPANIQDETENSDFVKRTSDVSKNKSKTPSIQDDDLIESTTNDRDVPDEESSPSFPTNSAIIKGANAADDISAEEVSNEDRSTEEAPHVPPLEIPPLQQATDIPVAKEKERRDSISSKSSPTSPTRSNAPRTPSPDILRPRINPATPGTVQRMRDRYGNVPVSPSVRDVGVVQPVVLQADLPDISTSPITKEASPELRKRGRGRPPGRANSQPHDTPARSVLISPSDNEEASPELRKRGRGRPPGRANSQPRNTRARSVATPLSGDEESSASQGVKRRGRPPLSEAIKAERQALKEALKEAKAAEKRAKRELMGSKTKKSVVPTTTEACTVAIHQVSSPALRLLSPTGPSSVSVTVPPVNMTPIPGSQWQTLPPVASSPASSSPAVDELAPSSQSIARSFVNRTYLRRDLAGIKSPGTVSASGIDENDVEEIVGALETATTTTPTTRQPLFLPGASQMTQSQYVPQFIGLPNGGVSQDSVSQVPVNGARKASPSGSDSESDIDAPAIIRRPNTSPKSAFPSLSQLSFDKFRPSFLMPKAVFSHSQVSKKDKEEAKAPQVDEESDSDDDDDSSDEEDRQSHIPKDKRAGARVVRSKKPRGLLQT